MVRFGKRIVKFFFFNANVRDMKVTFGHFGTGEDEPQVSVRGDGGMFRSLGEETDGSVFTRSTDIVSEAFSERACKRLTLF